MPFKRKPTPLKLGMENPETETHPSSLNRTLGSPLHVPSANSGFRKMTFRLCEGEWDLSASYLCAAFM